MEYIALSYQTINYKIITSYYYYTLYTHNGSKFPQEDSGRSLRVFVLSIRFVLRGLRLCEVLPCGD